MQRRAAAVSAAVFLLIAAGAYSFVGFAEQPSVEVDADRTLSAGDTLTVGGTEYTVTSIDDGSASIEWTNESARYTETLENDSTVPAAQVAWDGQTSRQTVTLENGSTVEYQGNESEIVVDSAESFVLAVGDDSESFETGDTLVYQGSEATVVNITAEAVTLAWGDPYRVLVGDDGVTLRQEVNVTRVLQADDSVENEVLTTDDGERFVRYTNGSTAPLEEYLPEPETRTFGVGDTMRYQETTVTVASADDDEATVEWFAPRTNTLSPGEGNEVTLGETAYLAHFPGNGELVLSRDFEGYDRSQSRVEDFHERMEGLWAVAIIAGLTGVLLIGMSYLPSRY